MFICAITKKVSKPGEKCIKIVTEKRPRTYYKMVYNEELREWERMISGQGWEIVKEVNATEEGARLWFAAQEDDLRFESTKKQNKKQRKEALDPELEDEWGGKL